MKENLPDLGIWILPQPKEAVENKGDFVPIPYVKKTSPVPFGYIVSKKDNDVLEPIVDELNALEQAKKYLKQYSSRHVAAWLTKITGRSITHVGLLKRVRDEIKQRHKARVLRQWARGVEKAISIAKKYEKSKGCRKEIKD